MRLQVLRFSMGMVDMFFMLILLLVQCLLSSFFVCLDFAHETNARADTRNQQANWASASTSTSSSAAT
jgi:hypothetical protein